MDCVSTLPWLLVTVVAVYVFWSALVSVAIVAALVYAFNALGKHAEVGACDGGDCR